MRRVAPSAIADAYRSGLLCREIADLYGISERTVRRALKREGVAVGKRTVAVRLKQALDHLKRAPDAHKPMQDQQ